MLKRHIQSWSQDSYEDSDVLPYDTSAGTIQSPPKATKTQVPEKKKKRLFWNRQDAAKNTFLNSKFLSQSGITFTSCYISSFHMLGICHPVPLLSPFPCHWSFKESSHVTSYLYLSPPTPGRIYYYLLWDFAKLVYWYLSWVPTSFLVGITQSLLREQRLGASLYKGHLKNLSWGTSATVITTSHYH